MICPALICIIVETLFSWEFFLLDNRLLFWNRLSNHWFKTLFSFYSIFPQTKANNYFKPKIWKYFLVFEYIFEKKKEFVKLLLVDDETCIFTRYNFSKVCISSCHATFHKLRPDNICVCYYLEWKYLYIVEFRNTFYVCIHRFTF